MYGECKTSKMHKEEINTRKVRYEDNFPNKFSHNCGMQCLYKILNVSQKIFILFKINKIPKGTNHKVKYVYSTIDVDEVVKNNLTNSNDISVTNVPNLNRCFKKWLGTNISNILNITSSEIFNYNGSSLTDVDNFLICITKQVCKNIEANKVEFDTFLHRDKATKNNKEIHTNKKSSDFFSKTSELK